MAVPLLKRVYTGHENDPKSLDSPKVAGNRWPLIAIMRVSHADVPRNFSIVTVMIYMVTTSRGIDLVL